MATQPASFRNRAEHYRLLAGLISDDATHRLLLLMAHEFEQEDQRSEPHPEPMPRCLS